MRVVSPRLVNLDILARATPEVASEFIPFNQFCPVGTEFQYIQEAIDRLHISGDGAFTKRCQDLLASTLGAGRVFLTTSCTHALEMAALLLDIQPDDEVILPPYTFVSTVNAFILRGARPVFVDIRPDTLNLDESRIESKISGRTKAIVPVHYAGVGCEMDAIMAVAARYGLPVVEDNAHGLFGKYRDRYLGTFGALATQSFHETKNVTCGEGGALLVNDAKYAGRAEIIRDKGTNRSRFFRGEVDKYTWVDLGSSYPPSDILSAILFAQLEARDWIQNKRHAIWNFYFNGLEQWAGEQTVRLPVVPEHCEHPAHMFYLVMPSPADRDRLISHLKERNILSVFHYTPLHLSEMGLRFGGRPGDCPVCEDVSARLLRLPFSNKLALPDLNRVVAAIREFRCQSA